VQTPSTRGQISEDDIVASVARSVKLALNRNKIRVSDLEQNFASFDESGEVSTGELGCNDFIRFIRKAMKLEKHEASDKYLRTAFYACDDDGSGKMSLEELVEFLKVCSEEEKEPELPLRVPGLIGGMRGELPHRMASRRPGTLPGKLPSRTPFCLNGRNLASTNRLAASGARFMARANSEPTIAQLAMQPPPNWPQIPKTSNDGWPKILCSDAGSSCGDRDSPRSDGGKTPQKADGRDGSFSPPPKKRVWNGKFPGKTCGGYMLLQGAEALNSVEDRLFEAGIDVRGHYHKLGRSSPM